MIEVQVAPGHRRRIRKTAPPSTDPITQAGVSPLRPMIPVSAIARAAKAIRTT
jgi:hypothetical protein